MHNCLLFAPKQTSARIDFLRQGGRLVDKMGAHSVKFLTENKTKQIALCTHAKATAMESMYAYNRQREQLLGMLPTANEDSIMQTQK